MVTRNRNLEWNVLAHDWNKNKVVDYNIFSYQFIEGLNKKVRAGAVTNIEELKEYIRTWAMRRYGRKAEYEIMVGDVCGRYPDRYQKTDIYRQIEMNMDRIVAYVNKELEIFM